MFQFISSPKKYLAVIGWFLFFLVIISFCIRRVEIEGFRFEDLVTYSGPLLLLFSGLHLMVSESRKDRTEKYQ